MIAKGTPHNDGAKLAAYLTTGKDSERATLWELRGFASDNIRDAFRSVHVMAEATRAEQPFFHVQVRNPDGENLTREQWARVADRIEAKLGLADQPRAIAFHLNETTGHEHMHVAWSRIDTETMTARPLSFFKLRLKEVCRELEIEMGLTRVTNERNGATMAPSRAEFEQARRLGIDIHGTRTKIRECWQHADDGRSFVAALADNELILARGDRRSFIVIDRAGGMHALGKRILDCKVAEVRERLAHLDYQKLPTVVQARMQMGCATRSAELDELARASAIEERDAAALLESITKQRATFTARDLDWTLARHIDNPSERSQFAADTLKHGEIIRLAEHGAMERYTTKAVLESEREVLNTAQELAETDRFEAPLSVRSSVLKHDKYENISREQIRALRHATASQGLALIDGQAGTGKSYLMGAIREVYEAQGFTVVGLAPTNSVAQDMKEQGFTRARTLHSELYALENGTTRWGRRTVVVLDEAAMIDTRNLGKLTGYACASGAKLILIGDERQLASIERGGMFGVLKDRYGAAELTEVRRQHADDDRLASRSMAQGNFRDALMSYEKKGAITWATTQSGAGEALINQWAKDHAADPSRARFVFAYTNQDVGELNSAIRHLRVERGELGPSTTFETKHGSADFAAHDRIQFTGTEKKRGLYNGQAGIVQSIDGGIVTVALDGKRKREVKFDAREFQDFRHGYSGTIYKGQGRTIDHTYLFHSEHWRAATSYVALTRHTREARLFVARDTTANMSELIWQMGRLDEHRAASHFHNGACRIEEQHHTSAAEETDWKRYAEDRNYRRFIEAQQANPLPSVPRRQGYDRER